MRWVREQLEMFGEGKLDSYTNLVPGQNMTLMLSSLLFLHQNNLIVLHLPDN